jgi:hypothetical protein
MNKEQFEHCEEHTQIIDALMARNLELELHIRSSQALLQGATPSIKISNRKPRKASNFIGAALFTISQAVFRLIYSAAYRLKK